MCLLQCLHCTDEAHIGWNRGSPVCRNEKRYTWNWRGSITSKKDGLFSLQPQTARVGNRKVTTSILRFLSNCPPTLLLGRPTQSLSIVLHLAWGTLCEELTRLRSKISWDIWQISCEIGDFRRRWRRKFWKKLDAASRFGSFFSLSLECQRSAGKTARRYTYTGASVFDRRQKFCESAARLDGLVNPR